MEVTTVSPSPASPTEGDDLCEIDVTKVAIHIVALFISLCGLLGNVAYLCLVTMKGTHIGIFHLAFADFLFLLFTVPYTLFSLVEDVSCSRVMPQLYWRFLFQLSVLSYFWALYRLTNTGALVNTLKLCCRCVVLERLFWFVDCFQFWALITLFTVTPAVTNLCPLHQQEHCRAVLISMYALILILFPAPMLISRTIEIIKAKRGSKKQKLKRRDIVIFLLVLFIVLLSLCNFLQELGYILGSSDVFFFLNCINSSIKPFTYFWAGGFQRPCSLRSLRLSLQRLFDEQEKETDSSNDASKDSLI